MKSRRGAKQATPDGTNGAVGQSSSKGRKGRPANHARVQQGMEGHITNSSFDPRNAGPVVSPNDRFAQLTKPAVCVQKSYLIHAQIKKLTSLRSFYGSRRSQCCLS